MDVDSNRRSDPTKDVKFKIYYKKFSCLDVKFDVSSRGKNVREQGADENIWM